MNRVGGGGDGEWRSQEKDVNGVEGGGGGGAGGGAEGTGGLGAAEWNPGSTGARARSSPTGGEKAEKRKSK